MDINQKVEISFSEFLERVPPNTECQIKVEVFWDERIRYVRVPKIELYCDSVMCGGNRFFEADASGLLVAESYLFNFLSYHCKNCQQTPKKYAIATKYDGQELVTAIKFGEVPSFGPHTPSKLIELIGPDRELFLAGRRCENQGLGIGAFVYYRRVVESQKNRIFEKIIQVTEKIDPKNLIIPDLKEAIKKQSFAESIDAIKHAIPDSLKINGYNPLNLLYKPLSAGVHQKSDKECLELAQSVRVVLVEFANNLSQALKDEAEIKDAISRLLK